LERNLLTDDALRDVWQPNRAKLDMQRRRLRQKTADDEFLKALQGPNRDSTAALRVLDKYLVQVSFLPSTDPVVMEVADQANGKKKQKTEELVQEKTTESLPSVPAPPPPYAWRLDFSDRLDNLKLPDSSTFSGDRDGVGGEQHMKVYRFWKTFADREGGLMLSRGLGDVSHQSYGHCAECEVFEVNGCSVGSGGGPGEDLSYVIVGSDGVWDDLAPNNSFMQEAPGAVEVANWSRQRGLKRNNGNSVDDVSALSIALRKKKD